MPALGVVRQNDGHSRRAVGEAERGATVGHRLSVGYDEVTAIKVFLGTLVGFTFTAGGVVSPAV